MRGLFIFGGVLVLGLGLLFFTGSKNNQSVSDTHQSANIGNSNDAQLAPEFSLNLLSGGTVNLSDFRGKKPVVVDFWATWCPNCQRDMPHLSSYYDKYKDQVEVIGVNLHENQNTIQDFIRSRDIHFPIALDPQSVVANQFGIQYTNTHFLISKDGKLIRTIPGDISESDIQSLIQAQ